MAFARDTYTASAAQTDFTITFGYLAEEDVLVYLDGTLQTQGASDDYTIVSSTTVRFTAGLTGGEAVVIKRSSSQTTRIVDYATASTLTEEDLDDDSLQAFYMAQEAMDRANRGNKIKQVQASLVATESSTGTAIPADDTIPQSTEGGEVTTVAITPENAKNTLEIEVQATLAHSTAGTQIVVALFQDSVANALAVWVVPAPALGGVVTVRGVYQMEADTTSATTFKLRVGAASGTTYWNQASTGGLYGNLLKSGLVVREFVDAT